LQADDRINDHPSRQNGCAVEQGARGPTRRQRAMYLSRGGLSDVFIRDTLGLDPTELHGDLKKAFDELSENTHNRRLTKSSDQRRC
jgi:hypothetical protein